MSWQMDSAWPEKKYICCLELENLGGSVAKGQIPLNILYRTFRANLRTRSLLESSIYYVGNGNPLQHSCLGNPMDRGGRWATVHGVAKGQAWLSSELQSYQWIKKKAAKGWRFARAEDRCVVSLTQWSCVWAKSGRRWRTGKPGMLQFMGSQRVGHGWVTEQQFGHDY